MLRNLARAARGARPPHAGRGAPDGAFAETLGIPIEMRETTMPAPDDAPRGA